MRFRTIFQLEKCDAIKELNKWIKDIENDTLDPMKKIARTIETYRDGILSWFNTKINNGVLEGLNSMIQLLKAKARGFKNPSYFKNIINLNYIKS